MTRRCPICGRFVRRGAAHCSEQTGDLAERAAMLKRIDERVRALFPRKGE